MMRHAHASICRPRPRRPARLHRGRGPDARARDWRQHRDLHRRQRRALAAAVLLGAALWHRRFGGPASAIGRSIPLDNKPYTIVGVLPPDFQLMQPADLVMPMGPWAALLPDDRSWHPGIWPLARLKAGVT